MYVCCIYVCMVLWHSEEVVVIRCVCVCVWCSVVVLEVGCVVW